LSFLFLLVAFLFVTGSAARSHSIRARRRRLYQQLARRYAGVYLPGGMWRRASVRLRYGETLATLSEAKGRGPFRERCTQIGIVWPDQEFCCEVLPNDVSEAAPRLRHLQEFSTGDDDFDRRFCVRVRDAHQAREFFREGVRWQIERLASLSAMRPVYILVRGGQILIQTPRRGSRPEELQAFVDRAFEFYDQVMLTRAEGIEFLGDDEAQPLAQVTCQVCGDAISRDMVFCRRCKTPHHADCWHFIGACSVYGCGERAYQTPQAAQRPSSSRSEKEFA